MRRHRGRILIVDDNSGMADGLRKILEHYLFYVRVAYDRDQALAEIAADRFDVLIVDWILPRGNSSEILEAARRSLPEATAIIHSAYETASAQSVTLGAQQFVPKGGPSDAMLNAVERGLRLSEARRRDLTTSLFCRHGDDKWFHDFAVRALGTPEHVEGHVGIVSAWGTLPSSMLWWMTAAGAAEDRPPFCEFDCRVRQPASFEQTVYGRASETSGQRGVSQRGLAELAAGGMLCVRNIQLLSHQQQSGLAAAAVASAVRRVGSDREIETDFRLMVTIEGEANPKSTANETCCDIRNLIAQPWLAVPAREDMMREPGSVVSAALEEISNGRCTLAADARFVLNRYPACIENLRDVKDAVERAYRLCPEGYATLEALGIPILESISAKADGTAPGGSWNAAKSAFETYYFTRLLAQTAGNISQAADASGIGRQLIYHVLKRNNIDAASFS